VGRRQHDRCDEAGEPGAGAQVDPRAGLGRCERHQLGAVGEVAVPDRIERGRRHQVHGLLPLAQQLLVKHEPLDRLARRTECGSERLRGADGLQLRLTFVL
jgi:hypothetical protein